jgi:hypothetical protein
MGEIPQKYFLKPFAGKRLPLTFAVPKSSLLSVIALAKTDLNLLLGSAADGGTLSPKNILQWLKKSQDL